MTTRNEYVEAICYSLTDDEVKRLFDLTKEELEANAWNMAIEFAYNEYVSEEEYSLENGF